MAAPALKIPSRPLHRRQSRISMESNPDMMLQFYELLQGKRAIVRTYSHALQSEICFINPARQNPEDIPADTPVYTTRELSFVLSLSPEEFRRFHKLKTRLVG